MDIGALLLLFKNRITVLKSNFLYMTNFDSRSKKEWELNGSVCKSDFLYACLCFGLAYAVNVDHKTCPECKLKSEIFGFEIDFLNPWDTMYVYFTLKYYLLFLNNYCRHRSSYAKQPNRVSSLSLTLILVSISCQLAFDPQSKVTSSHWTSSSGKAELWFILSGQTYKL